MIGKRALAAATLCMLACLLCSCGPGNTLFGSKGSVDFRLSAVESSLQKAQEELKLIARKQVQDDVKIAEMQKKMVALVGTLKAQGVHLPAPAPEGSALGIGFARPGATGAVAAPEASAQPSRATVDAPAAMAPAEAPSSSSPPAAASVAVPPKPPFSPAPSATSAARQTPPPTKSRRGYGHVGPSPAPATPEAAIAADREQSMPPPAAPPAVAPPSAPTAASPETPPKPRLPETPTSPDLLVPPPAGAEPKAQGEGAAGPSPQPAPVKETPARPASPVAGSAETAPAGEKAEYNRALQLAINGKPAAAKAAFEQFLTAHPQSPLTPNALYWVGEGAYSRGDFQAASQDFEKVIAGWPRHHKAADSLYKLAMSQEKAGNTAAARASFERYLKEYPNAELAGLARQKLQFLPK